MLRNRSKGAIVALVVIAAMLALPSAQSLPGGISSVQQSGCNCHGAVPSASVVASIDGLPESYNYSEEYEIRYHSKAAPARKETLTRVDSTCGRAKVLFP